MQSNPDGRTIQLFAVRIEPAGGQPSSDPVLVADDFGEPPGYADNAGLAQRVNREVILLDQRGTGPSEPNLDCPEGYIDISGVPPGNYQATTIDAP